ncbi:MAG: helix-turn-helix domain-containing protein [Methylobacillus sp.]|jgi:predicted metal-dependent HD superfamily phosphohydrolase|nr:helix-turn-helix domain-containing protein [Methylobacillus sp.]
MKTLSSELWAQRDRLLKALRRGSVSTLQARRDLDILAPAQRVFELRGQGYRIDTAWVWEPSQCGQQHRVAKYILSRG